MTRLLPAFLACFLYAIGAYMFRKPASETAGPFFSTLIVLFALFLLLLDWRLCPRAFEHLSWVCIPIEYIAATFLVELVMGDAWFPLDSAVVRGIPALATHLEDTMISYEKDCDRACQLLKNPKFIIGFSYFLSCSILVTVLHYTDKLDLCLLSEGPVVFFEDTQRRFRKRTRRVQNKVSRYRATFNDLWKTYFPRWRDRQDFCFIDESSENYFKIADHFYRG